MYRGMPKYRNKKVTYDGMTFDSIKEWKRYCELRLLEQAGAITGLRRQVKYILIPAQREQDTVGKRGGIKKGKLIEHEVAYYADFVYEDENGNTIVEDTKGIRTEVYKIKRKLMLLHYGIRIQEI